MIGNMDPLLYILLTLTVLSGTLLAGAVAMFWWALHKHKQRISELELELFELKKLYRAVTAPRKVYEQ